MTRYYGPLYLARRLFPYLFVFLFCVGLVLGFGVLMYFLSNHPLLLLFFGASVSVGIVLGVVESWKTLKSARQEVREERTERELQKMVNETRAGKKTPR